MLTHCDRPPHLPPCDPPVMFGSEMNNYQFLSIFDVSLADSLSLSLKTNNKQRQADSLRPWVRGGGGGGGG